MFSAFEKAMPFYWPQSVNMKKGDLVYIYVAHPYYRLCFETKILEDNIMSIETIDDTIVLDYGHFKMAAAYMLLEIQMKFDTPRFHFTELEKSGLNTVRRPSVVQENVENYIDTVRGEQIEEHEYILDARYIKQVQQHIRSVRLNDDLYEPYPISIIEKQWISGRKVYPRNKARAAHALKLANFHCEINQNHMTFLRKSMTIPYTEPHHLIPLKEQPEFLFSLDVEANIVSLCPACHANIHNGEDRMSLIQRLYEQRAKQLEQAGIAIDLEKLKNMYD